jgi:hypothetical protein
MAEWPALLLRRPSGDTDELKSRDLLRRFWNSAAGFWGQYGTPVLRFLSSASTDAADEGGCHMQTRCNESPAHGRSWASDVKGTLVYLIVGLMRFTTLLFSTARSRICQSC